MLGRSEAETLLNELPQAESWEAVWQDGLPHGKTPRGQVWKAELEDEEVRWSKPKEVDVFQVPLHVGWLASQLTSALSLHRHS